MLAIIWHSRTGTAEALARAAKEGAGDGAVLLCAEDVSPDDLLEALVNRHQPPLGAHFVKGRVARFFMHKRCSLFQ